MYSFEIKEELRKDLDKWKKKNKVLFEHASKKIAQIVQNPELGKPLRNVLSGVRRVHLCGCLVLVFEVNDSKEEIMFLSIKHHDNAYQ